MAQYRSLFDGKTLEGWRAIPRWPSPRFPYDPPPSFSEADLSRIAGHVGAWTVEDGAICGRQNPPGSGLGAYLISEEVFGDFELVFEAKPDWPADTGIMLRASSIASQGYQVLLDHRKSGNIGGFYGNGIGRFHAINFNIEGAFDANGNPAGLKLEDPETTIEPITDHKRALLSRKATGEQFLQAWRWSDWNEFKITVVGAIPRITSTINGLLVAELDCAKLPPEDFNAETTLRLLGRRGHIAFEVHDNDPRLGAGRWGPNAACRWREVRIRDLS
jgi:hypothetical protein